MHGLSPWVTHLLSPDNLQWLSAQGRHDVKAQAALSCPMTTVRAPVRQAVEVAQRLRLERNRLP